MRSGFTTVARVRASGPDFLDHLSEAGWTWGCSSHIDSAGRVLFTADAHRSDGKRFVVNADEKPTAFRELERVTHDDTD